MIDTLKLISFGVHPTQAKCFAPLFDPMFYEFSIDDPKHQAALIAQAMHESSFFVRLEESTYYSKPQIMRNAYKRLQQVPDAVLLPMCRKPEAFGNYVYANMLGNGSVASGDGYRFRGRGLFQLTGRASYSNAGRELGMPYETQPQLVAQPADAVRTAGWFWRRNNLGTLLDAFGIDAVSKRINGGPNGMAERFALYAHVGENFA